MTAEIVIMNRSAIALAADSAATLPIHSNGENKYKIYNTSNKLFMLSKFKPIGLMIYGNAEIFGHPWELVIKEFRKELGSDSYPTVKEYANRFITYLEKYFPIETQDLFTAPYITSFFRDEILQEINLAVNDITSKKKKIEKKEIEEIITKIINTKLQEYEKIPDIDNLPENFGKKLLKKNKTNLDIAINDVFKNLPISRVLRHMLYKLGISLFLKKIYYRGETGIVIAGFGEEEKFPAVLSFSIDGVFENILKYYNNTDEKISITNSASIIPFAQHEMVNTFIEGVDPSFNQLLNGYLSQFFSEYPIAIVNMLVKDEEKKKDILNSLNKYSKEKLAQLLKNLSNFQRQNFIRPIIDAVQFLPIDELAAMAESLVNLTSFKRRVSLDTETVGGPIDVAVITKGDGFIWIKRKHYFDEKLNHHFFSNYYRDCK